MKMKKSSTRKRGAVSGKADSKQRKLIGIPVAAEDDDDEHTTEAADEEATEEEAADVDDAGDEVEAE
jgi:hypothetical protein